MSYYGMFSFDPYMYLQDLSPLGCKAMRFLIEKWKNQQYIGSNSSTTFVHTNQMNPYEIQERSVARTECVSSDALELNSESNHEDLSKLSKAINSKLVKSFDFITQPIHRFEDNLDILSPRQVISSMNKACYDSLENNYNSNVRGHLSQPLQIEKSKSLSRETSNKIENFADCTPMNSFDKEKSPRKNNKYTKSLMEYAAPIKPSYKENISNCIECGETNYFYKPKHTTFALASQTKSDDYNQSTTEKNNELVSQKSTNDTKIQEAFESEIGEKTTSAQKTNDPLIKVKTLQKIPLRKEGNKNKKRQIKISDIIPAKKSKTPKPKNSLIIDEPINSKLLSSKEKKINKNVISWLNQVNDFIDIENFFNVSNSQNTNEKVAVENSENIKEQCILQSDSKIIKIEKSKQTVIAMNADGKMSYKKNNQPVPLADSFSVLSQSSVRKYPKFVAPIRKECKISNVIYSIESIEEKNIIELTDALTEEALLEINFTIFYKEGFSQLNKTITTTDTSCNPNGIMFYIKWSDKEKYFYMKINSSESEIKRSFIIHIMNTNVSKICFEAQEMIMFLQDVFKLHDSNIPWNLSDPKIACFLLNPDAPPNSFEEIITQLAVHDDIILQSACPKQKTARFLRLLSECYHVMKQRMTESNIWQLFEEIETKLISILAGMELRGICIDTKILSEMSFVLNKKIKRLENDAHTAVGKPFQLNSTQQLRKILFDELKLDEKYEIKIKETSILGAKSTSEPVLRSLAAVHPLPKIILNFRHVHKAKATFVDTILQQSSGGVIKATWEQTSAATGRITSCNPNLQAVPKQLFMLNLFNECNGNDDVSPPSIILRNAFIPRPGFSFVAADFQHIEFRVFAHMTQDPSLIEIFQQDIDIFCALAKKWLNLKHESEVLIEDREKTKRIVYALMYGAGINKIMEILHLDLSQTSQIVSKFSACFPALKEFGQNIIKKCKAENGVLHSLSGRIRKFPQIYSNEPHLRAYAERQAINFVIQGSAADLCKSAMVVIEERLCKPSLNIEHHLLLQIHDELVWEVPDANVAKLISVVSEAMIGCAKLYGGLLVPLPISISKGKSWGEMKPYNIE